MLWAATHGAPPAPYKSQGPTTGTVPESGPPLVSELIEVERLVLEVEAEIVPVLGRDAESELVSDPLSAREPDADAVIDAKVLVEARGSRLLAAEAVERALESARVVAREADSLFDVPADPPPLEPHPESIAIVVSPTRWSRIRIKILLR